jgi:hypothetical protein
MSWWMDLWHSTCHQTMAVSKVYSNVETWLMIGEDNCEPDICAKRKEHVVLTSETY